MEVTAEATAAVMAVMAVMARGLLTLKLLLAMVVMEVDMAAVMEAGMVVDMEVGTAVDIEVTAAVMVRFKQKSNIVQL
jgi:uncharacterized membrane protein